jgi:hypothetical protein
MNLISFSFINILGVVPELTSEWKPEIAPQAIVIKRYGNNVPGIIGPPPSVKTVNAGILRFGATTMIPTASIPTTDIFIIELK